MGRFLAYLATVPVGLEEPFRQVLVRRFADARIRYAGGGIAWFTSGADVGDIARLRCANNVFSVLAHVHGDQHDLARAVRGRGAISIDERRHDCRSFYLIGWQASVPMSPRELVGVERAIARSTGLSPRDRIAGLELAVMLRSDGHAFLLRRLTSGSRPCRARGQLPTALAALLGAITEPSADDIVVDPFCGSGAIAIERAAEPHRVVYASDRDSDVVRRLERVRAASPSLRSLRIACAEACRLPLDDASVSHVVTDPPWGHFRAIDDIDALYASMLEEHARIVRSGGTLVYLTAATESFERAWRAQPKLGVERRYPVLVSGKKAVVFVVSRR